MVFLHLIMMFIMYQSAFIVTIAVIKSITQNKSAELTIPNIVFVVSLWYFIYGIDYMVGFY